MNKEIELRGVSPPPVGQEVKESLTEVEVILDDAAIGISQSSLLMHLRSRLEAHFRNRYKAVIEVSLTLRGGKAVMATTRADLIEPQELTRAALEATARLNRQYRAMGSMVVRAAFVPFEEN